MNDNTKLNKDGLNQVWLKAMTILKSLVGNVRTDEGTLQEQIDALSENASSGVDLTQAEYDALPASKETDGVDYYIIDEDFIATDAKATSYDNSESGLTAKTVQVAIDEVYEKYNDNYYKAGERIRIYCNHITLHYSGNDRDGTGSLSACISMPKKVPSDIASASEIVIGTNTSELIICDSVEPENNFTIPAGECAFCINTRINSNQINVNLIPSSRADGNTLYDRMNDIKRNRLYYMRSFDITFNYPSV